MHPLFVAAHSHEWVRLSGVGDVARSPAWAVALDDPMLGMAHGGWQRCGHLLKHSTCGRLHPFSGRHPVQLRPVFQGVPRMWQPHPRVPILQHARPEVVQVGGGIVGIDAEFAEGECKSVIDKTRVHAGQGHPGKQLDECEQHMVRVGKRLELVKQLPPLLQNKNVCKKNTMLCQTKEVSAIFPPLEGTTFPTESDNATDMRHSTSNSEDPPVHP